MQPLHTPVLQHPLNKKGVTPLQMQPQCVFELATTER